MVIKEEKSIFLLVFLYGPSGTRVTINSPPKTAKLDVIMITDFQAIKFVIWLNKWGKAVPITRAPTKKPNDFPKPFS